jgi:hypothetical protein
MTAARNDDPLADLTVKDFEEAFKVGTISVWSAAQSTMKGWKKLHSSTPKTFIYTGNLLPWAPVPKWITLGVQKAATAHLIEALAIKYGDAGYRYLLYVFLFLIVDSTLQIKFHQQEAFQAGESLGENLLRSLIGI